MPTVAQFDQPLPGSLEEAQQRYEATKKALKSGIAKKRQIDRALTDIESQIFLFEGSYLATTAASGGNIVKGFDGYLKSTATGGYSSKAAAAALAASAADVPIEDRMFSQSSATYTRSLQLKANEGRSREQSPTVSSSGKKADRDAPSTPSASEKSKDKKRDKGNRDADSTIGDVTVSSSKKGHANGVAGDATPTTGKSKKRDREKEASVNGSHKKKRKDDD